MILRELLKKNISAISSDPHVDKKTFAQFMLRLSDSAPLLKQENAADHFCCFFLPVHIPSHSIYMVHHIKAQSWIPPGGHIEPDEIPEETIRREFKEELDFTLTDEPIRLFNIGIKHINAKTHPCRVHYDLWYSVACREKAPYRFLKQEFYDANWYGIQDALTIMSHPDYQDIIRKMRLQV